MYDQIDGQQHMKAAAGAAQTQVGRGMRSLLPHNASTACRHCSAAGHLQMRISRGARQSYKASATCTLGALRCGSHAYAGTHASVSQVVVMTNVAGWVTKHLARTTSTCILSASGPVEAAL